MHVYDDNGQVSLDIIHEVESSLGYNFPMNYINLIKDYDALRLENDIFDFKNIYGELDERDICFLSFQEGYINGSILKEQSNINDLGNYGIKDLVIFGICANGDYICFDYREDSKTSNPKIYAGGDLAGKIGTVAWAAKSGRDAAISICEDLKK